MRFKDAVKMEDYRTRVNPVGERFGGRHVVIGGPFRVLEGSYQPVFLVMIEFPSIATHGAGTTPKTIAS